MELAFNNIHNTASDAGLYVRKITIMFQIYYPPPPQDVHPQSSQY